MAENGNAFAGLYDDLKGLARNALRGERPAHTLQPTELVHEAWMRMARAQGLAPYGQGGPERSLFLGQAARAMRRILVDHARARLGSHRRRDLARPLEWDPPDGRGEAGDAYLVDLNEALEVLSRTDARAARVVELRLFGGLSVEEAAGVLDLSPRTIKREWRLAKAWLHRRIVGEDNDG